MVIGHRSLPHIHVHQFDLHQRTSGFMADLSRKNQISYSQWRWSKICIIEDHADNDKSSAREFWFLRTLECFNLIPFGSSVGMLLKQISNQVPTLEASCCQVKSDKDITLSRVYTTRFLDSIDPRSASETDLKHNSPPRTCLPALESVPIHSSSAFQWAWDRFNRDPWHTLRYVEVGWVATRATAYDSLDMQLMRVRENHNLQRCKLT